LQINEYGGRNIHWKVFIYWRVFSRVWSSGDTVIIGNRVQISHGVNIIDNNTHSLSFSMKDDYEYVEIIKEGNIKKQADIAAAPISYRR
jgi:hypothetical protein